MRSFVEGLALSDITLFGQDWGGLIGLRIAAEDPQRYARIVAANTFLPTGEVPLGEAFEQWRAYSQRVETLDVGWLVGVSCAREVPPEVRAAYDAPFPDERYKVAARRFPLLVPAAPDDPAAEPNRRAWEVLRRWEKPFLTIFGDSDPVTRGADRVLQQLIPGARGQPHAVIERAGHFLQEDAGEEIAEQVARFAG